MRTCHSNSRNRSILDNKKVMTISQPINRFVNEMYHFIIYKIGVILIISRNIKKAYLNLWVIRDFKKIKRN